MKTRCLLSPRTSGPSRAAGWGAGTRSPRQRPGEGRRGGSCWQRGEDAEPKASEGNGRDWKAGWRYWGETQGLIEEAAGWTGTRG